MPVIFNTNGSFFTVNDQNSGNETYNFRLNNGSHYIDSTNESITFYEIGNITKAKRTFNFNQGILEGLPANDPPIPFASFDDVVVWVGQNFSTSPGGSGDTGWARYSDTEYDSENPFSVMDGEVLELPNNAASIDIEQIPTYIPEFYDQSLGVIPGRNGDAFLINIVFNVVPTTGGGNIQVLTWLDIGTGTRVLQDSKRLARGQGVEDSYSSTIGAFNRATWEANSAVPMVSVLNGDIEIYNILFSFMNLHRAT